MGMARPRAAPGALLQVDLLGRIEVRTAAGTRVSFAGRHAPALFALLILVRRPRTREAIAADLWPESDTASAGSLRQALWLVRHGLSDAGVPPDSILDVSTEAIGIRADANIALDIVAFEACLDATVCGAERAVGLYGGDLVESLGHDCFAAERERLADRYEDALVTVAERRLAEGDLRGAIEAAQRVIARDPLREEAHAILIAVHGLVGSRAQIVRQYRRLQVVLERELGEPPLPETDATYRLAMRHAVQRSMERAARIEPDRRPALVAVSH
jgi:DNA-binding SARP family transcriptional activator